MTPKKTVRFIVTAAIIAALYTALVLLLLPFSFSYVQVRVAEALSILPLFTFAAVPGLFVGCLLANILGGALFLDVLLGSLTTGLAALLTYLLRKNTTIALFPPVLLNAVVIGPLLHYVYQVPVPLYLCCIYVGIGQAISCYGLGLPLQKALDKAKHKLF